MKAVLLAILLAMPATARADVINPPGGPVQVDDDGDEVDQDVGMQQVSRRDPAAPMPQRDPNVQRAKRAQLRAALMQQFDVNGDGKLGPRERQRAVRVLQRLERRLGGGGPGQGAQGQQRRAARMRKFIQRYDVNGDGNVGPNEVPAGAANRLRRFDRNGDGWVTPGEFGARRRGPGPRQPDPDRDQP